MNEKYSNPVSLHKVWLAQLPHSVIDEENDVLLTTVVKGVAIAKIGCFNVSKQNPTALAVWVAGWQAKAEFKLFSLQMFCAGKQANACR